jgi:hypothetical protein
MMKIAICLDRYRYLKLLQELVMTHVRDVEIEKRWDSRFDGALDFREEPLLADFDAASANGFVYDDSPEAARPMISIEQCGRILVSWAGDGVWIHDLVSDC